MTRKGYKMTALGEIPNGWDVKTLVEAIGGGKELIVAGPLGSNLKVSDYRDEGVPIIRLQNIERSRFINKDIKYITNKKAEELSYHSFRKGDLVLAKLGDPVGKTCIIPDFLDHGIVVADVVRIRVDNKIGNSNFFNQVMNSYYTYKQLNSEIIGTTRPRVNLDQVRDLMVPIVPLPEQHRISEVLTTIDDAIEHTESIIAKFKNIKQGLMADLLTKGIDDKGNIRSEATHRFKDSELGRIPEEWDVLRLGDHAYIKGRIGWKGLASSEYVETGPYLIAGNHIKSPKIIWEECNHLSEFRYNESPEIQLKKRDIIISKDGTIGRLGFINRLPGRATINSTMMLIRIVSEKLFPKYVYHYFEGEFFQKIIEEKVSGSTVPHIFQRDMTTLIISAPRIHEQQRIANVLTCADNRIEREQAYLDKLILMKEGLMQDLLTGKVRVNVLAGQPIPKAVVT